MNNSMRKALLIMGTITAGIVVAVVVSILISIVMSFIPMDAAVRDHISVILSLAVCTVIMLEVKDIVTPPQRGWLYGEKIPNRLEENENE